MDGDTSTRDAVAAAWLAQHQFGGALLGEHLGQLLAVAWSATVSVVILRSGVLPRALGATGLLVSALYLLNQGDVLATAVPGFPVWDLAGPVGSTSWGLWVPAPGSPSCRRRVRPSGSRGDSWRVDRSGAAVRGMIGCAPGVPLPRRTRWPGGDTVRRDDDRCVPQARGNPLQWTARTCGVVEGRRTGRMVGRHNGLNLDQAGRPGHRHRRPDALRDSAAARLVLWYGTSGLGGFPKAQLPNTLATAIRGGGPKGT